MVYAAMFALHWEAFARWLVDEEKDLECMCVLSNNVQLLLDVLSEEDVEKATSACADATDQLKKLTCLMAEFDEACTSPTTKLWLMYMDMVMILSLKALPVLTAVSEQTKAMAHLDADDTKHHKDKDSQGAKEAEGVRKITDVINNQMINPFRCEEQELINISTGHKATSADLICAREKGLEALAPARRTDSEKVAQIKLSNFAAKPKKSMSMAFKAKKVYEEESAVVRNLYFVQDLEEDRKVEVFGHEWTSCPASLFEPDPSLDQSYAMCKGNKADYLAAIKTALGSSWGEVDKLPPSDKPVVMVVDAMAFTNILGAAPSMNCKEST